MLQSVLIDHTKRISAQCTNSMALVTDLFVSNAGDEFVTFFSISPFNMASLFLQKESRLKYKESPMMIYVCFLDAETIDIILSRSS